MEKNEVKQKMIDQLQVQIFQNEFRLGFMREKNADLKDAEKAKDNVQLDAIEKEIESSQEFIDFLKKCE